jgi:hypothetical protein
VCNVHDELLLLDEAISIVSIVVIFFFILRALLSGYMTTRLAALREVIG